MKTKAKELDWDNLTLNKCPKCMKELSEKGGFNICDCGFKIGIKRMNEIVESIESNQGESFNGWLMQND